MSLAAPVDGRGTKARIIRARCALIVRHAHNAPRCRRLTYGLDDRTARGICRRPPLQGPPSRSRARVQAPADRYARLRHRRLSFAAGSHRPGVGGEEPRQPVRARPGHAEALDAGARRVRNGVAMRYLDFNDAYAAKSTGHPSDVFAGVLAAADAEHADGRIASYRRRRWPTTRSAISPNRCPARSAGIIPSTASLAARSAPARSSGSRAKGDGQRGVARDHPQHGAGADAPRRARHVEGLRGGQRRAQRGVRRAARARGNDRAGAGDRGQVRDVARDGEIRVAALRRTRQAVPRDADLHQGVPIGGARAVADHGGAATCTARVAPEDIEAIAIETYWVAERYVDRANALWHPATRETADHSIPYCVAAALIDGRVTEKTFSGARIRDPRIAALIERTTIRENPDFDRSVSGRVAVPHRGQAERTGTQGARRRATSRDTRRTRSRCGDRGQVPLLAANALAPAQIDKVLATAWRLEKLRGHRRTAWDC